eukprot:1962156-Prymnesium_polylepis.2
MADAMLSRLLERVADRVAMGCGCEPSADARSHCVRFGRTCTLALCADSATRSGTCRGDDLRNGVARPRVFACDTRRGGHSAKQRTE